MERKELKKSLRSRYSILIIINACIFALSIAAIVLFVLIIIADPSNQDPYHNQDESGCPKPKFDAIKKILKFFYGVFFVVAFNFLLIEIKNKLTRNVKYNLLNLATITIKNNDELDQLKTAINSSIQIRSKKFIGFVYLAGLFVSYFTNLFAQCETFVTPIEIVSLITRVISLHFNWAGIDY
jgi:hypothetical protein